MGKKIVIVDYSLGNMFSVQQAFAFHGIEAIITADKKIIESADAIVLPGVGAFGEAMNNLNSTGLTETIKEFVTKGKPFLGICLGMQLLFESSDEFGSTAGLGIIKGKIKKFQFADKKVHVPQMAWNNIIEPVKGRWKNTVLEGIANNEFMYFVHSFYSEPENTDDVLCLTNYEGFEYCSAVNKANVTATQFHPEKSADEGLKIYKNWIEKI